MVDDFKGRGKNLEHNVGSRFDIHSLVFVKLI